MTDDLVKQLRKRTDPTQMLLTDPPQPARDRLCWEAADRIEQLEAALRPFAEKYLWPDDTGIGDELRMDEDWDEQKNDKSVEEYFIERGWIRAARAALGEKKDG